MKFRKALNRLLGATPDAHLHRSKLRTLGDLTLGAFHQEDVAEALGMNRATISRKVMDDRFTADEIIAVARYYNLDPIELLLQVGTLEVEEVERHCMHQGRRYFKWVGEILSSFRSLTEQIERFEGDFPEPLGLPRKRSI